MAVTVVLLHMLLSPGAHGLQLARVAPAGGGLQTLSGPAPSSAPCEKPGWFPDGFGLKDHTVFWHDGLYYIASTYLAEQKYEQRFAYASSQDFCHWTDLGPILTERPAGAWDEFRVWAPYAYVEDGVYYLYYTGVTQAYAQSIMLATSTDPSRPGSWQRQGMVFQPAHPDAVWAGFDAWSDCRDPTVVRAGDRYYLYYTGLDQSGGIIGVATASSPIGPWTDWGAMLTLPRAMPESPTIAVYGGLYYLFYHSVGSEGRGELYHYGPSPQGPWSAADYIRPGWAHEIWMAQDGDHYTSYLTGYAVNIRRLTWDDHYSPPHPFIGAAVHRAFAPLALRQTR